MSISFKRLLRGGLVLPVLAALMGLAVGGLFRFSDSGYVYADEFDVVADDGDGESDVLISPPEFRSCMI